MFHTALLADENFTNLLRAEGLESLQKYLADRIGRGPCCMSKLPLGFVPEPITITFDKPLTTTPTSAMPAPATSHRLSDTQSIR